MKPAKPPGPCRAASAKHADFLKLAKRVYQISKDDMECWEFLYREGDRGRSYGRDFKQEARSWRNGTLESPKTYKAWRTLYLFHMCKHSTPITTTTPMYMIASIARYICCRVEIEIRKIDAKERRK